MIELQGLDHVVFRTTKLEAMLHFYCHILGCHLERRLSESEGLVQLRAGRALIDIVIVDSALGRAGGGPPRQDGRNVDHICLQITPQPEADLINYFNHHNVEHSEFANRYGAQGFGRSVYLHDPEGNVVELRPVIDDVSDDSLD